MHSGDPRLWGIAVLDLVANNADRKLGHILDVGQHLVGIDHGLTFHPEDKLRTVLWGFAGSALPHSLEAALQRGRDALAGQLGDRISALLGDREAAITINRVERLLVERVHPPPPEDRPPLPWPAY